MNIFLCTLFMILLLRNLIETLVPDGRVMQIAKGTLRGLCFVWILSAAGALLTSHSITEVTSNITKDVSDTSIDVSESAVWIQNEYESILTEYADAPLAEKGMTLTDMDIQINEEGTIQHVEAELTTKLLAESLVEIQIQDIVVQDPAIKDTEDYRKLLSEAWGIPMEAIQIHISK